MNSNVKKPSKISILIILLVLMILPNLLIINEALKSSIKEVDFIKIVSILYTVSFFCILIIQLISKKNYYGFVFSCHNKKERSCKLSYKYLHICSRCTGILIGIILSPLILLFKIKYTYLLILLIPLVIDGSLQHFTKYQSNNLKRLITGLMFGVGFIIMMSYYNFYKAQIILYLVKMILKIF